MSDPHLTVHDALVVCTCEPGCLRIYWICTESDDARLVGEVTIGDDLPPLTLAISAARLARQLGWVSRTAPPMRVSSGEAAARMQSILVTLTDADEPLTATQIRERIGGLRRAEVYRYLTDLERNAAVERIGRGRGRDPYRWRIRGAPKRSRRKH